MNDEPEPKRHGGWPKGKPRGPRAPQPDGFSPEPKGRRDAESDRIARGTAAWKIVKSENRWAAWEPVCDSLAVLSHKAMRLAATNAPKGKQYSLHFNALLKDNELDDIPKTTRAAAIHCGHHLKVTERHLETLKKGDYATYLRMNHPQALWAVTKPLTLSDEEKAEADRLKQEREAAKAGNELDFSEMDADEIADTIYAAAADQAKPVRKALLNLVEPKAVVLTGDERPGELVSILVDELKISNVDAYMIIHILRTRFARPQDDPPPDE